MLCASTLRRVLRAGWPAAICTLGLAATSVAQTPPQRLQLREPVLRVPRQVEPAAPAPSGKIQLTQGLADLVPAQNGEHPLSPAVRVAKSGLQTIDTNIKDFSATLVKRERVGDTLGDHEYIFTKVRHQPFSVYMYFLGPAEIKGREAVYVAGMNNSKVTAHEGGRRGKLLPTVNIEPTSFLAMRNQRYPITEVGVRNLTMRLIEVGEKDMQFGECEVKYYKGTKINGRSCTCIEVIHPVPRQNFTFHLARIFIDEELEIPVRHEAYLWPAKAGDPLPLIEEYTYMNIKVNNGFTDADFSDNNPDYHFHGK